MCYSFVFKVLFLLTGWPGEKFSVQQSDARQKASINSSKLYVYLQCNIRISSISVWTQPSIMFRTAKQCSEDMGFPIRLDSDNTLHPSRLSVKAEHPVRCGQILRRHHWQQFITFSVLITVQLPALAPRKVIYGLLTWRPFLNRQWTGIWWKSISYMCIGIPNVLWAVDDSFTKELVFYLSTASWR